jgi:uncharacterized membrane protein
LRLEPPAAASPAARLPLLDAARGLAVAAMVVYHFSWDLRFFGFIAADVAGEPGWRVFARAIAGSFLLLVGAGLVLATRSGFNARRFLQRLATIAAAAAAITVVTYIVFPETFIFFGILHAIAVGSVLGLAFVRMPIPVLAVAALLCFLAPLTLASPAFDAPALVWLGLGTVTPRSNDFVPVFPWFGVVLAGMALTRLALRWPPAAMRHVPAPHPLVLAGRHSLGIYLLHQPLLFGLVWAAAQLAPPSLEGVESSYLESCTASCVETALEPAHCSRTCACLAERSKAEGLWRGVLQNSLSEADTLRYYDLAEQCRVQSLAP